MNIFHIFYLIGMTAAIVAGIPQLRKLLITKQADEFSVSTWMIWLFSQITALGYSLSTGDMMYSAVSAFWLAFYAVMVGLIFKYRNNAHSAKKALLVEEA